MSFTFRAVFTGICTYVRNTSGDQLCVLLPDGTRAQDEGKKAIDGEALSRHQGFLEFDPRQAGFTYPKRLRVISEIQPPGGRIQFSFTGGSGAHDFTRPADAADLGSLCDPASLAKLAPSVFDSRNPRGTGCDVLAQVVFDRGILKTKRGSDSSWYMLDSLGHGRPQGELAHEIMVEVASVTSVDVYFTPFKSNAPTTKLVTLSSPKNPVELTIANLCDRNPLRWPLAKPPEDSPDIDFKWHFELVANRQGVDSKRDGRWLPCPIRVRTEADARERRRIEQLWRAERKAIWEVDHAPSLAAAAQSRAAIGGDNCFGGFAPDAEFTFPPLTEEA